MFFLFIFQAYQDYEYYGIYNKEQLAQFFFCEKSIIS